MAAAALLLLCALAAGPAAALELSSSAKPLPKKGSWASASFLSYLPPALHSNCGYLSYLAATTCAGGARPAACCEALCAWNGAGCGCTAGLAALVAALPLDGAPSLKDFAPGRLAKSACAPGLGPLYSSLAAGTCARLPPGGSATCKSPKPALEACSTKAGGRIAAVTSLVELLYHSAGASDAAQAAKLRRLLTAGGAVAEGSGPTASGVDQVMARFVRLNRLRAVGGAPLPKVYTSVVRPAATSRTLAFAFSVRVVDAFGAKHTLGPFNAVATFAKCSSKVESLFVASVEGLDLQAAATPSPFGPAAALFSRGLPSQAKKYKPNEAYTPTPTPSGRRLSAAPGSPRPPHPPAPAAPVTMATVDAWLAEAVNKALALPAVTSATFRVPGCSTNSTLDDIQFCGKTVVSGSKPLSEVDSAYGSTLASTCNVLCADGAWQAAADFVCDYGCGAAVAAGCSSCQAGCSAACSTCTSGCSAGCSTCEAGVNAACATCNTGCCFGCQVCTPAVPEVCTPSTPESCCCGGCCWGICVPDTCIPGIPGICTPAVPGYCTSTQLCPNGACDSTCDVSANCGGACDCSSACASTCDCTSDCAGACDVTCPDCDLNCQQNCESSLNAANVNYQFQLDSITGLGSLTVESVTTVGTTPYVPGKSSPTATFEVVFSVTGVTVTGHLTASLSPSYGTPSINKAVVKSNLSKVFTKQIVRVDHLCSATLGNIVSGRATGNLAVSTSAGVTTTSSTAYVPASSMTAALAPWSSNFSADATVAMATAMDPSAAVAQQAASLTAAQLSRLQASILWGWVECAAPNVTAPMPPSPPFSRSPRPPRPFYPPFPPYPPLPSSGK